MPFQRPECEIHLLFLRLFSDFLSFLKPHVELFLKKVVGL